MRSIFEKDKELKIYSKSGTLLRTIQNCEYKYFSPLSQSCFIYPSGKDSKNAIMQHKLPNFLFFNQKEKSEGILKEIKDDETFTVYIHNEEVYQGIGFHYVSRQEALNSFTIPLEDGLLKITYSDNIPSDVLTIISEKIFTETP